MTFHKAITVPARELSDSQIDSAIAILGEHKRHLRFAVNWRSILTQMEAATVYVTDWRSGESKSLIKCKIPVNDEHRKLCEAVRPINRRLAEITEELFERQSLRGRKGRAA